MAAGRVALVTKEGARLLASELQHLRALGNRFGELELTRIDALQLFCPAGARCCSPVGRRAQRAQMHIIDPGFGQSVPQRSLGKTGTAGIGHRSDVDDLFDPGGLQGRQELILRCSLVTDREDAHVDGFPPVGLPVSSPFSEDIGETCRHCASEFLGLSRTSRFLAVETHLLLAGAAGIPSVMRDSWLIRRLRRDYADLLFCTTLGS